MTFVADGLGVWLVEAVADAGRKGLTTLVLGSDLERALHQSAKVAIKRTAQDLFPQDDMRAEQLAMVVNEVFGLPAPASAVNAQETLLEALQVGVAARLAPLDDRDRTGTGESSAAALDV